MAMQHQIKCSIKSESDSLHESIAKVGGMNIFGKRWELTVATAIKGIEFDEWAFFIKSGRRKIKVEIAKTPDGQKYLRTEADNENTFLLLGLPDAVEVKKIRAEKVAVRKIN